MFRPSAMGLLSRLRSASTPTAGEASPVGRTWRRNELFTATVGDDAHLVYRRGGLPLAVPAFAVDFLFGCRKFRPLEEHVAEHAERHRWGALESEALRSWLPRMIEAELLISSRQMLARCTAMRDETAPPLLDAVGFPTGGARTALVERALRSFAENFREHGRSAALLISDGSAQAAHRADFRALAAATGARYAGEEEKRRYAAALVQRSGCDPAAVEFALFDPLGTGFSCGANRNAIVLHGAGRMVCSVDDDVICRIALPPPPTARLALFSTSDPFDRQLFPDRESGFAAAEFGAWDFLAGHEAMLGRGPGALCGDGAGETDLDLANVGDELLRRLHAGPAQVRATFAGHLGDPGIPSATYYLYYSGENRARLPHDDSAYRAMLGSRSTLARAAVPAIGDASVSPGMAMGLDARSLLPPFFPVLHAEDYVFGATLWQCSPHALLGHLPWSVVHDPGPGKSILLPGDLGPGRRMVVPEFAHLMRRLILECDLPDRADAATRTLALGRHLRALAARPAADFQHALRTCVLALEGEKLAWLAGELRDDEDSSECWRQDVEAYLAHKRDAFADDDFDIPYDLKASRTAEENRTFMQRLIGEFGHLLEHWPSIFAAAQEITARDGEPLFRTP
jgi:hypothetical protein